ncbi:putative protein kinase RLK-Pelle-LRR-I-1 family [Helianthus annuus]|nr:putative protein kinase RLK-Pelle-LRR-I-1 family [Helianthus annuus]
MSQIQEVAYLQIPLQTIKLATNDFSQQNFIGQGGFGRVYKGELPHPNSEVVAVKRLDRIHGQGQTEFIKEIVTLASYKHDNIVSIIGFCDEDGEKVLVYKYEVNGSLDNHLANPDLTWEQRLRICIDAARGLKYLHDDVGVGHRLIHRDIKSGNILLDEDWKAKISDFGLCKVGPRNEQFSFLVTLAAGTYGYIDPQYMQTGVLTKESDVYSFGIVLFEVLCGRLAMIASYSDHRTFLHHLVKRHLSDRKLHEICFANLNGHMKSYSLDTFLRLAYSCTYKGRKHRPTMGIVVEELEAALEHQIALEDRIGKRTMLWGSSSGGYLWSFMVNNNQKLRSITIDCITMGSFTWIHSISFTKKDLDGTLHSSDAYGGLDGPSGGPIFEINLDDDEEITGISLTVGIYYGMELVSSLCFVTNKRNHGPFGMEAYTCFSESWDAGFFAGFYGRCGAELDAIGCCFTSIL